MAPITRQQFLGHIRLNIQIRKGRKRGMESVVLQALLQVIIHVQALFLEPARYIVPKQI